MKIIGGDGAYTEEQSDGASLGDAEGEVGKVTVAASGGAQRSWGWERGRVWSVEVRVCFLCFSLAFIIFPFHWCPSDHRRDARVSLIGFPSVGKSTILSKLTPTESVAAAYEFTTLTCIPGNISYKVPFWTFPFSPISIFYLSLSLLQIIFFSLKLYFPFIFSLNHWRLSSLKGARIQLLDTPGIIEGHFPAFPVVFLHYPSSRHLASLKPHSLLLSFLSHRGSAGERSGSPSHRHHPHCRSHPHATRLLEGYVGIMWNWWTTSLTHTHSHTFSLSNGHSDPCSLLVISGCPKTSFGVWVGKCGRSFVVIIFNDFPFLCLVLSLWSSLPMAPYLSFSFFGRHTNHFRSLIHS